MSRVIYRLIRRADSARDAARWDEAAVLYRTALTSDPDLYHLRIQLGHMLKQTGDYNEADAVYADAARLCTGDAEPVLHRAHLARLRQDANVAIALFIDALMRGDRDGEAERELRLMLDLEDTISPAALRSLLETTRSEFGNDDPAVENDTLLEGDRKPLLFDVTDLIGHFQSQRLPTGIQRVQIEVLDATLRSCAVNKIILGCFVTGHSGMIEIPLDLFLGLTAIAGLESDIRALQWQEVRARMLLHLMMAGHMTMPMHAILINLGTSLWVSGYFLFIRNAKLQQRISYIPFVHDLMPIIGPKYCVEGVRKDFAAWLAGLYQHADGFLVNSRSTLHDLQWAARYLGHGDPSDRTEVVPLDAVVRCTANPLPSSTLNKWELYDISYVLMVSTVEPRKNHALAFDAWARLLRMHGRIVVPRLVCVGRDGWLNDQVFGRLAADPELMRHVTIIHSVSDSEMALLYQSSLFTIYPSHYEGWGLPITESLCHGKLPIVANNSSLPEAGAGFACLFESGSESALVDAVERAAFDTCWRDRQEAWIKREFTPRSWSQIAEQIVSSAEQFASLTTVGPEFPAARLDVYYAIGRHQAMTVWPGLVSGEIFRIGDGWFWPEADGCRTKDSGGELRMRLVNEDDGKPLEGGPPLLRLYLRLRGLTSGNCPVIVDVAGNKVHCIIPAAGTVWLASDVPADISSNILVKVCGLAAEEITHPMTGGTGGNRASVTVVGMILCDGSSEAANQRLLANIDSWRGH